jgi:hypothetical protein
MPFWRSFMQFFHHHLCFCCCQTLSQFVVFTHFVQFTIFECKRLLLSWLISTFVTPITCPQSIVFLKILLHHLADQALYRTNLHLWFNQAHMLVLRQHNPHSYQGCICMNMKLHLPIWWYQYQCFNILMFNQFLGLLTFLCPQKSLCLFGQFSDRCHNHKFFLKHQ